MEFKVGDRVIYPGGYRGDEEFTGTVVAIPYQPTGVTVVNIRRDSHPDGPLITESVRWVRRG